MKFYNSKYSPLIILLIFYNYICENCKINKYPNSNTTNIHELLLYIGWLVTGGTSGKGMILREKRSRKYRIKIFRLKLCFRENRLWIFARYACTLSRLVMTDLIVDRYLDWRYVDKHFQCDRSVFLPINLLSDFYRYPLSVPISLLSCLHTAIRIYGHDTFVMYIIYSASCILLY